MTSAALVQPDLLDTRGSHVPLPADARKAATGAGVALWMFVCAVVAVGGMILVRAAMLFNSADANRYLFLLVALTLLSGRYKIKIPGRSATVCVSEVFIFSSIFLFGPAPATLTVALDGLFVSLTQRDRRGYRALFNVAEPAISTWVAGSVFFAIAQVSPAALAQQAPVTLILPSLAMSAAYFLSNSTLTAVAVALEDGASAFGLWKRHALYLAINYNAASSLAMLAVNNPSGLNPSVVGLVAPLLLLSYAAYKSTATGVGEAERHVREVEHLYQATIETLAIAVDAKDQVTHGHLRRVQRHTIALAKAVGVTANGDLKALEAASLLHDVGKLAVPDYVLNKPGALSRPELDTIKLHASKGADILTRVEFPYPVVPLVRHHHEQWTGGGYPDGLAGTAIPLGARILTVVDCFDAVTSDRPYRRRLSDQEGVDILLARRGSMYDPGIVDAFIALIPELRRIDAIVDAADSSDAPESAVTGAARTRGDLAAEASAGEATSTMALLNLIGPTIADKLNVAIPSSHEFRLFALDTVAHVLRVAYATPLVRNIDGAAPILVGEGLSGWVAANRHTIVNSTSDLDLGDVALQWGLRWCTSTPVFALGDLVGVLTVYSARAERFSERDVRRIGILAQDVGMEVARCEIEFVDPGDHAPPVPAGPVRSSTSLA